MIPSDKSTVVCDQGSIIFMNEIVAPGCKIMVQICYGCMGFGVRQPRCGYLVRHAAIVKSDRIPKNVNGEPLM